MVMAERFFLEINMSRILYADEDVPNILEAVRCEGTTEAKCSHMASRTKVSGDLTFVITRLCVYCAEDLSIDHPSWKFEYLD
jgi:hypothetical protein